jgi:hypothetical protein
MENPLEFADTTRREILRKAVFVAPSFSLCPSVHLSRGRIDPRRGRSRRCDHQWWLAEPATRRRRHHFLFSAGSSSIAGGGRTPTTISPASWSAPPRRPADVRRRCGYSASGTAALLVRAFRAHRLRSFNFRRSRRSGSVGIGLGAVSRATARVPNRCRSRSWVSAPFRSCRTSRASRFRRTASVEDHSLAAPCRWRSARCRPRSRARS